MKYLNKTLNSSILQRIAKSLCENYDIQGRGEI